MLKNRRGIADNNTMNQPDITVMDQDEVCIAATNTTKHPGDVDRHGSSHGQASSVKLDDQQKSRWTLVRSMIDDRVG